MHADIGPTVAALEAMIPNPHDGLPDDVFLFATRITPMINVDLLIKNDAGQTLLTWRAHTLYYTPGWHVPGGIVRYKESLAQRVHAVAQAELGAEVAFDAAPIAIREVIQPPERRNRGHFISLLFRCRLLSPPDEALRYRGGATGANEWQWHDRCPDNLLSVHAMYRDFF